MVGLGGLEPPASPLSGVRSNQLSYRPGEPFFGSCEFAPQNARSWRSAHVETSCSLDCARPLKET